MARARRNAAFWACFAALTLLLGALVFSVRYMPLVDLPQHAAQLSIFVHYDDPAWGFRDQFELNWGTPYVLLYVLARPLVPLFGVLGALHALLFLSVVGLVLATRTLTDTLAIDPFFSLLSFPAALGFSFWFGFANFLVTAPFVILFLVGLLRYCESPTRRTFVLLSVFAALLFWAHGLVSVLIGLSAALMTAIRFDKLRDRLSGTLMFVPATLVFGVWSFLQRGHVRDNAVTEWKLSASRIIELPALITGASLDDTIALVAGVGLLAMPLLFGLRPSPRRERWVPLAASVLLVLALPFKLAGVSFLHQRFALFVPAALLLAFSDSSRLRVRPALARPLVVTLTAAWIAIVGLRVRAFDADVRSFDGALAAMQPARSVRPIVGNHFSEHVPGGFPYVHFVAYYQALKGGRIGFSFARNYTSFVRYRRDVDHGMARDAEWNPLWFSWKNEGASYDYFVVFAGFDARERLFADAGPELVLLTRSGDFWVYERRGERAPLAPKRRE